MDLSQVQGRVIVELRLGFVVESTSDLETVILSTNTYIHLPRNSILAIEHQISNKLWSLHQSRLKPSAHPGHLKTSASPCPRFIGQPEIHNPNIPLHPIMAPRVSTIYNKVRHLTKILHPQLGLKQYHITNLSLFVNIINDIHLGQTPFWRVLTKCLSSPIYLRKKHVSSSNNV